MSDSSTPRLRPVAGIGTALKARWGLLVVGLVWGIAAGYLAAYLTPPVYSATTTVRLGGGLIPVGDMDTPSSWVEDEVALTQTRTVREAVAAEIGGISADQVRDRLVVSPRDATSFLDFTYTADDGTAAEEGAAAASAVYLEQAKEAAVRRWTEQAALMGDLIATAPKKERPSLRNERQALNRTVVDVGQVADPAVGSAESDALPAAVFPLAGGLGGLLLAAALAYLLEARRPRVRRGVQTSIGGVEALGRLSRGRDDAAALVGVGPKLEGHTVPVGGTRLRVGFGVLAENRHDLFERCRAAMRSALPGMKLKSTAIDLDSTEGLRAARKCDGVVLLAVEGWTTLDALDAAISRLRMLDVECFGVVTTERGSGWWR